ncbi:MAG: alpha/beta hydrolase [Betaproteobacteria bacterium]|nr:alpha/beta hydrolase [Betaproteobacteria bacterium]MDH5222623.1 alpha/beta hydrolase [Betaproteobacteria bacterium]MDH5351870.1 alpha/beta hydrolase [Betaproteobacteria bacterium]
MSFRQQSMLSLGPEGFHRVAYTDWGDPDNPHVVMCVHGLSRNSRDFDYLAQALRKDYRVICMDVVGRGESDWLADKSGYSFSTYLSDAAALVARVTTPVRSGFLREMRSRSLDWVGTSMGGLIGMLLAAKRNSPVGRLVMNDVGPFVPWNGLFRLKGHLGHPRGFGTRPAAAAFLREALAAFGPLTDAQWAHLTEHSFRQHKDGRWHLRFDPAIGQWSPQADPELPIGPEFLRGIDLWSVWNAVHCPVLVLRGANSDVLPAPTVKEMRRRKPGTQVEEFEGVGHAPALMDRRQIDAVRAFLKQRRSTAKKGA